MRYLTVMKTLLHSWLFKQWLYGHHHRWCHGVLCGGNVQMILRDCFNSVASFTHCIIMAYLIWTWMFYKCNHLKFIQLTRVKQIML